MKDNTTTITKADTIIDINNLRDMEISILCSMIESKESFNKIIDQLTPDYFTFLTLKLMYESISAVCIEMEQFDKDFIIEEVIIYARMQRKIHESSFRRILKCAPSTMLDADVLEVRHFSEQKYINIDDKKRMYFRFIEDSGDTTAVYANGRLIFIMSTNVFSIPKEIEDVQFNTLRNMEKVDPKNLAIEFDKNNSDYIEKFIVNR